MTVGPRWRCRQASRASPIDWERSDTDALALGVCVCCGSIASLWWLKQNMRGGHAPLRTWLGIWTSPPGPFRPTSKRPGLSFPGAVVEGHAAPRDASGSEVLYTPLEHSRALRS